MNYCVITVLGANVMAPMRQVATKARQLQPATKQRAMLQH